MNATKSDYGGPQPKSYLPAHNHVAHVPETKNGVRGFRWFWISPTLEILESVGLPRLLRHEYGHCHGLVHPDDDRQDEWVEIADADRGQIAAIARRQWLQIKGQRDVDPAPARTVERREPPKARPDSAPGSTRAFSGDGY